MAKKKETLTRLWLENHDENQLRLLLQPDHEETFKLYISRLKGYEEWDAPKGWELWSLQKHQTYYTRLKGLLLHNDYYYYEDQEMTCTQ